MDFQLLPTVCRTDALTRPMSGALSLFVGTGFSTSWRYLVLRLHASALSRN